MQADDTEESIFSELASRRSRSPRLSDLAREQGLLAVDAVQGTSIEVADEAEDEIVLTPAFDESELGVSENALRENPNFEIPADPVEESVGSEVGVEVESFDETELTISDEVESIDEEPAAAEFEVETVEEEAAARESETLPVDESDEESPVVEIPADEVVEATSPLLGDSDDSSASETVEASSEEVDTPIIEEETTEESPTAKFGGYFDAIDELEAQEESQSEVASDDLIVESEPGDANDVEAAEAEETFEAETFESSALESQEGELESESLGEDLSGVETTNELEPEAVGDGEDTSGEDVEVIEAGSTIEDIEEPEEAEEELIKAEAVDPEEDFSEEVAAQFSESTDTIEENEGDAAVESVVAADSEIEPVVDEITEPDDEETVVGETDLASTESLDTDPEKTSQAEAFEEESVAPVSSAEATEEPEDIEKAALLTPEEVIESSEPLLAEEPHAFEDIEVQIAAESLVEQFGDIVDIQKLPKTKPMRVLTKAAKAAETKSGESEEAKVSISNVPAESAKTPSPAKKEPASKNPESQSDSSVVEPSGEKDAEQAAAPKKKRKRVSLLDSYFKGL